MALMNFWNSKSDLETKRIIFMALPMQTVLYGCEYWTLTDQLRGKLSTFQHKSMRRVLGINMHDVQELHIKNEQVNKKSKKPLPERCQFILYGHILCRSYFDGCHVKVWTFDVETTVAKLCFFCLNLPCFSGV